MTDEPWDRKWTGGEKAIFVIIMLFTALGGLAYWDYKEKQIRDDFLKKHSQEIMNLESVKKEQLETDGVMSKEEPWDRKWTGREKAGFVLLLILNIFLGLSYYFSVERNIRDDFLKKHFQEITNLESVKKEQLEK